MANITMTNELHQVNASAAQQGIWLGQQLNPTSTIYNAAECIEIKGEIRLELLVNAIKTTISGVEALHAKYHNDKGQATLTLDTPSDITVDLIDISDHPSAFEYIQNWSKQDLTSQVDLVTGPIYRQVMFIAGDNHLFWYQRSHHIALDGYAFSLIARKVADNYQALLTNSEKPEKFPSIVKAIEEDHYYRSSAKFSKNQAFWQDYLIDLSIPPSLSKNIAAMTNVVKRYTGQLSPSLFLQINKLADNQNLVWSDIIIASFAAYLARTSRCNEVVLGLPVMNRMGSTTLNIPTMVMNIVPLRISVSANDSIVDIANLVAKQMRLCRPHHKYRYEDMRRDLNLVGGQNRLFGPVVNIMPFDYQLSFGECKAIAHNISAGPVEDLALNIYARSDGQPMRIDFDSVPEHYTSQDLQYHQQQWLGGLACWLDQPNTSVKSIFIDPAAKSLNELLICGESIEPVKRGIIAEIAYWVRHTPNNIALVDGDVELSYQQLWQQLQSIAASLRQAEVELDDRVALYIPRGRNGVMSMLACIMIGACFVPLEPNNPAQKIKQILDDIEAKVVIAEGNLMLNEVLHGQQLLAIELMVDHPSDLLPVRTTLDADAYIMYTSGSTGKPKGVRTSHRALAHFTQAAINRYQFTADDNMLQFASMAFDAVIEEVFVSLASGASLVLRNDAMLQSISAMLEQCERHHVTVMDLPTAYWHEFVLSLSQSKNNLPQCVRAVIIGGEAALSDRVQSWQNNCPNVKLWNTYGPTEATVVATTAELSQINVDSGLVPIGRPLPGYQALILDEHGFPLENTTVGELYLLGDALSSGYLNRKSETNQRFVSIEHWHEPIVAYRTGDKVTRNQQGDIMYLGRIDDEFKISGHRVDPAEIEIHLLTYPGIEQATVVGHVLLNGARRLVAHVVGLDDSHTNYIKDHLSQHIAAAIIPNEYLYMKNLPLTTSGKIDRSKLRQDYQSLAAQQNNADYSPETKAVIQCLKDVLGIHSINQEDNFFSLGGQSLQTIQFANRLSTQFDTQVDVADIFSQPIIQDLTHTILQKITTKSNNHTANDDNAKMVEMVW